MNIYSCLKRQIFEYGEYSIIPIRLEDKYLIMKWRNEQLYHLRQLKPLTKDEQDIYFSTIISNLFNQKNPNQILFSYLQNGICIGYGGLVHINWKDRNAEISFIINTEMETETFDIQWTRYLKLIEEVSFSELKLHKIYVYAFDLRPHLYNTLEKNGFQREATLIDHALINETYKDVVLHCKINPIGK